MCFVFVFCGGGHHTKSMQFLFFFAQFSTFAGRFLQGFQRELETRVFLWWCFFVTLGIGEKNLHRGRSNVFWAADRIVNGTGEAFLAADWIVNGTGEESMKYLKTSLNF